MQEETSPVHWCLLPPALVQKYTHVIDDHSRFWHPVMIRSVSPSKLITGKRRYLHGPDLHCYQTGGIDSFRSPLERLQPQRVCPKRIVCLDQTAQARVGRQ